MAIDLATLFSKIKGQYDGARRTFALGPETLQSAAIADLLTRNLKTRSIVITGSDGPRQAGDSIVVSGTGSLYGFTSVALQAKFWLDDMTGGAGTPEMSVTIVLPRVSGSPWSFTGYFAQLRNTVFDDVKVEPDPPPRFVFASAAYEDQDLKADFPQGMNFYGAVTPGGPAFAQLSPIVGSLPKTTLSGPIAPHDQGPAMALALDYNHTLQRFFPSLDIPVTIALKSEFDAAGKRANVGVLFRVSFRLGDIHVTLETLVTNRQVGVLNVWAKLGGVKIPEPQEIAKLAGAGDLVASLPARYQAPDAMKIDAMGFGISTSLPPKVTDVWMELVPAADGWEIVPDLFELSKISGLFKVLDPLGNGSRKVSAMIFGSLQVTKDHPILNMDLHASAADGAYLFQASLAEGTTFKLRDLLAKLLPAVQDAPDLVFDNLSLEVRQSHSQTRYGFEAGVPDWSFTIGEADFTVAAATVDLNTFVVGGRLGGEIAGTIEFFDEVETDFTYTLPGDFRIVTRIPELRVDFKTLAAKVIRGWPPPDWFPSFTLPKTEIHLERYEDTYQFQLMAEPGLGVIFLQVKRWQGEWGIAAGLDLRSPKIAAIPGLEALGLFDDMFQLDDLMFVISSITVENFQFPDQSSFSNAQKIKIPTQSNGLQAGFNLFAAMTFGGSKEQEMMRKFLGFEADARLGITLHVGKQPATDSRLFVSVAGKINDKTSFAGEFGGALQAEGVALFLDLEIDTEVSGTQLKFEVQLVIVETGALLSGTYTGPPLKFDVIQLNIRAIEIGIDWEGVPSLGIIADIDVEAFHSSIALFFDSTDPANSMAAGAVSDLTLKDIVDMLAGSVGVSIPAEIEAALAKVAVKGLGGFTMPVQMAGIGDIATALDTLDLAKISAAFQKAGNVTLPTASQDVMLSVNKPGNLWYLTDLSNNHNLAHYELSCDGTDITVSLEAQFYFVPNPMGTTIAGKYRCKTGYKVQGELDFFDLKVKTDVQISQNKGISVDATMDPIVIGGESFLAIRGSGGHGGPVLSLSTYKTDKPAPYDEPHFLLSAEINLLGVVGEDIFVQILGDKVQFDLKGSLVQDIDYELSGHFDGLNNFGGGGGATVAIDTTLDFGKLGKLYFNMSLDASIELGWNGSEATATCESAFDFKGHHFDIAKFDLDIDGASLAKLVSLLTGKVKDRLDDWLHVMEHWLDWFKNGILTGVDDAGKVLEDVFGVAEKLTSCPTTTAVQMMARVPGAPPQMDSDDNLQWLRKVREDLQKSTKGQYWLGLYDQHKEEVSNLLHNNQDVKDAVKNQQGLALLMHIIDVLRFGAKLLDKDEATAANAVVVIVSALIQNGSSSLGLDLLTAEQEWPQYYGKTYEEILQALNNQQS